MAGEEKLCCSPSQKAFRYYGDWENINIFRDTKWHKISVKESTLREVYCKSLWIFYSNQTEMRESSPELWFWIWQDNWKERKGTTGKDKIILILYKNAENIMSAFFMWYGQNHAMWF